MAKSSRTIDSFFKRKDVHEDDAPLCPPPSKPKPSTDEHRPSKSPRVQPKEVDNNKNSLVRDPGLRRQIWDYPISEQDEIRRAYIKAGPYQFQLSEYPFSKSKHPRRFQFWWFEKFHWLEYSPLKDAAFCLPCFLFAKLRGHGPYGSNAFTLDGFQNWKKVNDGTRCAFKKHVTEEPCSTHNITVQSCNDLMNQGCHIDKAINRQTSEQIMNNRLRLKSFIDSIRWLTFQGCAFRGHDESLESKNRGNFIDKLFGPTCVVLQNIINDGSNYTQRGDADAAYDAITSFEFIFILHLMKEIMGFTNILCQALQQKSQDISNAMHLISTTKALIQNMREDVGSGQGVLQSLLENVNSFCSRYKIDVPNMSDRYLMGRGRSSHKKEHITIEHHYRVEIFTATIDSQLQELNNIFSEQAMELLTLSSALDPRDDFKSFNIDNICKLADKFYPMDFTEHERDLLNFELKHYKLYVSQQQVFQKMSTISELCRALAKTRSSHHFPLIDRLIRLILTLPVSTATTERAFSVMKLVKTGFCNKMDDKFLANYLVVYIEKEIAEKFSSESIIDDFMSLREHPGQL
ncbi:hypothetical protein ACOSQ2_017496 [Xanthoceras sorbifolium]